MKLFLIEVVTESGKMRTYKIYSNYLGGAIRKCYQMYDIEDIKRVQEV